MNLQDILKSLNDPKVIEQVKKLNLQGEDLKKYLISKGIKVDDTATVSKPAVKEPLKEDVDSDKDLLNLVEGAYGKHGSYQIILGKVMQPIDEKSFKTLFKKLAKDLNVPVEKYKEVDLDSAQKLVNILFNELPSYKDLALLILKNVDKKTLQAITKCLFHNNPSHFHMNTTDKEELKEETQMSNIKLLVEAIKSKDLQKAKTLLEAEVKQRITDMKDSAAKEIEENPCFEFYKNYNNTNLELVKEYKETDKNLEDKEQDDAGKPKCNCKEGKCNCKKD